MQQSQQHNNSTFDPSGQSDPLPDDIPPIEYIPQAFSNIEYDHEIGKLGPRTTHLEHGQVNVEKSSDDSSQFDISVDNHAQQFIHSRWTSGRERIKNHCKQNRPDQNRLEEFFNCGRDSWLEQHQESGEIRLRAPRCRQRYCPRCAAAISRRIADEERHRLSQIDIKKCRTITLTPLHNDLPLRDQIKELKASFRRLRQTRSWKSHIDFGTAVIEFKISKNDGKWHPHIHTICSGKYWDLQDLIRCWQRASRGARNVKINVVTNGTRALEYLTKYIAKPCEIDWGMAPAKMIDEWLDALPRQRLVIHFGDWPETTPLPEDTDWKEDNRNWKPIFDLELICRLSAIGQPAAIRLLLKLKKEKEP